MLLELLILLTSSLLVAVVLLVVAKIVSCKVALMRFNKLSRGLPVLPGARLLDLHARIVFMEDRNCEKLQKWHQEMGPTIGFLRNSKFCVSTVDLDLIKTFIVDEPEDHLNRINQITLPMSELNKSIANVSAAKWRPIRRAVALALAPNKFKTPNVQQDIDLSIEKLIGLIEGRLRAGKPEFVADDILSRYSLYLMFKSFYKQDDLVDFEVEHDEAVQQLDVAAQQIKGHWLGQFIEIFPQFIGLVEWLLAKFTPLGHVTVKFRDFIDQQIRLRQAARKQLPALKREAAKKGVRFDPHDFVLKDGTRFKRTIADHLTDQFVGGKLSRDDLAANNLFLMLAAYRTASDCLIHTSYLISIHPEVQDKLRASIMAGGIDSQYLDWVLLESLRLLPPAPTGCSRVISRDIELSSGHVVPKGTFVLANAYVIHRQKEYWGEDADEFRPDRWRDTSHHHPMQFQAFGAGLRHCPGRQFAMYEMKMVLVALLARYKITGEPRDDAYTFVAPHVTFIIPNSETILKLTPINGVQ